MGEFIAGVEEAGRGPVIGPMVMAIVTAPLEKIEELESLGVTDSKKLSPKRREFLYRKIKKICYVEAEVISPEEIDSHVQSPSSNLNRLESKTTASLITKTGEKRDVKKVILDCPEKDEEGYSKKTRGFLSEEMKNKQMKIIAEHNADENYTIVGASSIIAKVTRDREVKKIEKRLGEEIGSGYPSDPTTASFLKKNIEKDYDFFRKSWSTYQNMKRLKSQRKLADFKNFEESEEEHREELEEFDRLLNKGFRYVEPKAEYEILRMKGPESTPSTIVKYTSGKLLVQGNKKSKKKTEEILRKVGLR